MHSPSPPESPRPSIADACSLVLDTDGWRAYLLRFAEPAPEYLSVFGAAFCRLFDGDLQKYQAALATSPQAAVDYLLPVDRRIDTRRTLEERRQRGVVLEFLMGSAEETGSGATVNESMLHALAHEPGTDIWVGLPLNDPSRAMQTLEDSVAHGARGSNVIPFLDGVPVTDPRNTHLFGALAEAGLPVWIHSGHHFASRYRQGADSWRDIDDLARRHPRLTIVIGHAGWPQVLESTLVASRHANVHLEFSSHRPRVIGAEPEWRALIRAAHGPLRKKILFGTSRWVNPQPVDVLAAELASLPIAPEVASDWLSGNALRLSRPESPLGARRPQPQCPGRRPSPDRGSRDDRRPAGEGPPEQADPMPVPADL